jgi:hypothetical protein
LNNPEDLFVDNTTEAVYVADNANGRIVKFAK